MGWLLGYEYRKLHTINGAAGAGTNYQQKIKAYYDKRPIGSFTYVSTTGADVYSCQGVATDGTFFYTTSGDDNKHIYKFNSSWVLQSSHDCSADWPVGCTQVNHIFYKDGKLYLGACDYPDATPEGWIMVYNASDLSYDTVHSVGAIECEGCAYYDGYWWVIRGDSGQIKKYNTSWVHQTDYNLTHIFGGNSLFCPGYQGIIWKDDFIYVTIHKDCIPEERCDVYYFDGTNFTLIKRMNPPTIYCSQGLCLDPDGETVWWAERDHGGISNDDRVVKSTIAFDNEEVGLNKNCKTDFGDLRITKSDGTTIYAGNQLGWREHKINNVFAIIWWKMPDDLGTAKDIYIYYGNNAAPWADGGISSVMDHVNDFETGTVQDFTNAYNGGSAEASTTEKYEGSYALKTLGASQGVYSNDKTFWSSAKKAIDIWMLSTADNVEATICWVVNGDNIKRVILTVEWDGVEYSGAAGSKRLIDGNFTSEWIKYSIKLNADATKCDIRAYNSNLVQLGHAADVALSEVSRTYRDILFYDAINYNDLIFSHKYTVPEPTHGSWGSEQSEKTKESSIGLSVQETHIKESSIGLKIIDSRRKMYPWVRNFKGFSEDGRIEIFPGVFEDGRSGEKTQNIKESSIGISVSGTNTKESSIGLSVQETHIKESSIGITVVVQETKESSIGISVSGTNTKESSIGITVGFPIKIEKETGILIFYGISEDGRIEISPDLLEHGNFKKVARLKIKESSIGISIQETFTKESSIGITVQETHIKESSIGITVVVQETKESSIGITVIDAVLKQGFYYAKLGGIPLVGVEKDNFRISKEINQTPSFEFEIANCEDNRVEIHNRITEELEIFWWHHGKDTHVFTGVINADGIEYISLDNIQISGFASYVKLSWPFHKHLADEDKESVNRVFDFDGSYTNYTTQANNDTINDVYVTFGNTDQAFYIGDNNIFWGAQIKYSTAGIPDPNSIIVIEYSKGAGTWGTLNVLDESDAFTQSAGTYNLIIPHPPNDWKRNTVNWIKRYWIRYRLSGVDPYILSPKLDRIYIVNVDVYRTYYFDTSARAILLDVLEGTGYTMDETDTCPEDIISIVAEYQSPLRLIAAIPNALSWIDAEDSNKVKAYQWWIDNSKKVHMKKRRGTIHSDDITGDMTIFNNHEDYFHLSNQLFGLGPREGLSQIRAIVRDTDSIGTHGLREIAVSEEQIANYNMLKTSLQKKIAISKDPMQRIRGSVSTQFWGLSGYEVGDTVTLHQEKWNVANKPFQIVKVDMGPRITTLDLGISQDHLEGLRDNMQRRMDFNNVQMHGSTTLLEAGPETSNYQRIDATTVYPAKLEIEIPSTVKKIHKVLLSWTLGPYRADVGPNTSNVPAHDHDGSVGDGGAVDGFNAGPDGAHTPAVSDDGAFTPQVIGGQHVHLTETSIQIDGTTTDVGVLQDPVVYPDAGKVLGGNHRHLKGSTGPANNVEEAFVRVEMEKWCDACSEYIIQAFERSSFALGNHIHLNSNKYTGYTNPPAYVNVWSASLITSLNAYAFSKTSATETEDQAHEGVDVLAHGHAGVAVGNHSGHAIPAVLAHGDHAIVSAAGGALTIDYSIYEVAGGTDMELLVNGESVGIYSTAPQTEIRIDGWLNSGNNTVTLQPKVGEINKKGGATLKASGLLFIEPVKF